jgi:M6 family metalloprotease-like protein
MNKRSVLAYSFCLLAAATGPDRVHAVPAQPSFRMLAQEDGTTFRGRKWGDESRHGWEAESGHTILQDEEGRGWFYAERDADGRLVSSGRLVGRDVPPSHVPLKLRPLGGVKKTIGRTARPTGPLKSLSSDGASATAAQAAPLQAAPSSFGTANVPIILANFSDRTTTHTPAEFTSLLFGDNTYSFKDYYQEVSSGHFSVSPGPAGIMGWVRLSKTHDYYGANDRRDGEDLYPGDVVYEAVVAVDPTVDFAPYDGDGDCYVDAVAIVHQGTGEEQAYGLATDIWSHSWTLSDARDWGDSHYGAYTTNDICAADPARKVIVDAYIIQPERQDGDMVTVGVFAHEYGHVLGLPDLYDYDYSSEGVGEWSLMSGGSWTYVSRDGDRPSHLDAWCKYQLGWVIPRIVRTAEAAVVLPPVETGSQAIQLLNGSPTAGGEYFLLENRQKTGFDAGLPGAGLLVWHVDESIESNDYEWYPGCRRCSSHYKVALLQSDGAWHLEKNLNSGDTGDPFPGSTGRTTLTSDTVPNNRLYSGATSGFFLDYIRQSGTDMVAAIGFGSYGIPLTLSVTIEGVGGGTVTSVPAGIFCGSSSSADFPFGSTVTLTAEAAEGYRLAGWYGACSGTGQCVVTMGQDTAVTAAFELAPTALLTIGAATTPHTTLSDAVYTIPDGAVATLMARDLEFQEDLIVGGGKSLSVLGGYDSLFAIASGYSTIRGAVIVENGSLTLDSIVIW